MRLALAAFLLALATGSAFPMCFDLNVATICADASRGTVASPTKVQDGDTLLTFRTFTPADPPHVVFSMSPGACLRGPLEFFDAAGKSLFKLDDRATYPANCDKE